MTITALPTPPSRADAANFATRADAFLGALPTFVTEANATATQVTTDAAAAAASAATALSAPGTQATSSTTLAIATGAKSMTASTGKSFVETMWVNIASASDALKWMTGPITGYNSSSGALSVNVQRASGTGTFNDWIITPVSPILPDSVPRALADGSTIADPAGGTQAVGFRGIPFTSAKTSAYTLAATDSGRSIPTNSNVTVPPNSSVPITSGETFAVLNSTGSNITIVQGSGVTLRLPASSTTGNRTVAQHSEAYLRKIGTDEWLISGAGVS